MRGTGFVIVEIVWWMVAAAVVGALIGWLVRGWRNARIDAEWLILVTSLRDRISQLEGTSTDGGEGDAAAEPPHEEREADPADGEPEDPERTADDDVADDDAPSLDEPADEPDATAPDVEGAEAVGDGSGGSIDPAPTAPSGGPSDDEPELLIELTDASVGPADPFGTSDLGGESAPVGEDELETS